MLEALAIAIANHIRVTSTEPLEDGFFPLSTKSNFMTAIGSSRSLFSSELPGAVEIDTSPEG
jgi:hypothetical protein